MMLITFCVVLITVVFLAREIRSYMRTRRERDD